MKQALRPTQVVAQRVREYRTRQGWSARELAERCMAAGLTKWERNVVTNLENGRRENVSIEEVLVLAYVLSVPPVMLFVPLGTEEYFAVTPTVTVHPDLALQWITGDERPVTSDRMVTGDSAVWTDAVRPIRMFRRLREIASDLRQAHLATRLAARTGSPEFAQQEQAAYVEALRRYAEALDAITESGMRAPAIGGEFMSELRDLGLLKHPDMIDTYDPASEPAAAPGGPIEQLHAVLGIKPQSPPTHGGDTATGGGLGDG